MAQPIDVFIDGLALLTDGFVGTDVATTEGVGLNTFGFLWPINGIWGECFCIDNVDTVWVEYES